MTACSNPAAVIRKLRQRIWLNNILDSLSKAFILSSSLIFLLSIGGHVATLTNRLPRAAWLLAGFSAAAVITGMVRRPGLEQAAREGDGIGMQDRLTTYLEYGHRQGQVIEDFKAELDDALAQFDPVQGCKIKSQLKPALATVLLLAAAACIFFIPSAHVKEARSMEAINRELKQEAQKVESLKKTLEEENGISESGSETQAAQVLARLEKRLNNGSGYLESALEVENAIKEIDGLQTGFTAEEARALAGVFDGAGADLARAASLLRHGDSEKAADLLAHTDITEQQRQILLKNTRQMLANGEADDRTKQRLEQLETRLNQEGMETQGLAAAIQPKPEDRQAADKMRTVGTKLESMKERLLAKAGDGFQSPGGNYQGDDVAEGENPDRKNGEITGNQASSLAQGNEGSPGWRSPNAVGGGVPGGGAGEASGREGRVAEGDSPTWGGSGSAGEQQQLQGSTRASGGRIEERISDRVVGLAGESGRHDALTGNFGSAELEYLDKYQVPADKKQMVMEYFRSLKGGD